MKGCYQGTISTGDNSCRAEVREPKVQGELRKAERPNAYFASVLSLKKSRSPLGESGVQDLDMYVDTGT